MTVLRQRLEAAEGGPVPALWSAAVCAGTLLLVGLVGIALDAPWVFPSLGPTLMVLAETPQAPAAQPRNVLCGHVVGVAAGYLALLVTGLSTSPPVVVQGLTGTRVLAACMSVALTALVLQLLRTPHPPAGATTLIVSLGLLRTPASLLAVLLSVLTCTAVATALNAVAGVRQAGVRAAS